MIAMTHGDLGVSHRLPPSSPMNRDTCPAYLASELATHLHHMVHLSLSHGLGIGLPFMERRTRLLSFGCASLPKGFLAGLRGS